MRERRYDDREVAEIFRTAADRSEGPVRSPETGDAGLTLSELQEIGSEVGIRPEVVAEAAGALDRPRGSPLSLSVGHAALLPRDLRPAEWERLVSDLRTTFQAVGKVHVDGGLRGWTNGNLHAFVEPVPDGSGMQLRMGSRKESARGFLLAGGVLLTLALVLLVVRTLAGGLAGALDGIAIISLLGMGNLAFGGLTLPSWKATRRRQMEEIAMRTRALLESPEDGEGAEV